MPTAVLYDAAQGAARISLHVILRHDLANDVIAVGQRCDLPTAVGIGDDDRFAGVVAAVVVEVDVDLDAGHRRFVGVDDPVAIEVFPFGATDAVVVRFVAEIKVVDRHPVADRDVVFAIVVRRRLAVAFLRHFADGVAACRQAEPVPAVLGDCLGGGGH